MAERGFWHFTAKGALFLVKLFFRTFRVLLAVILLSGIAAFFLARHYFDEDRARAFLVTQLQEILRRPVQLGQVVLTPHGMKVRDVRVMERLDVPGQFMLTSDTALVTIRLKPLLKRRIELGTVRLIKPKLQLIRDAEGKWNVADIFVSSGAPRRAPASMPLAAEAVFVEDGDLKVDDRYKHTRYEFERVNLEVRSFDMERPFGFSASFHNSSTIVSSRTIVSDWQLEGEMSLAGLDWPNASARASSIRMTVDGQEFKGRGAVTAFSGAVTELDFTSPALSSATWDRYLAKPFDLALPAARWKVKLAFPTPKELEFRSVEAAGEGFNAAAAGLVDFSSDKLVLTAELRSKDIPMERVHEIRSTWARWGFKGVGEGRISVRGPLARLNALEAELSVRGFGMKLPQAELASSDLTLKTSEDYSRLFINLDKGVVEAYGFPFKNIAAALSLVKGDLKLDNLAFNWSESKVKLKARVQNVTAPKEVVIAGQADKVKWEDAQQLVANVIAANPSQQKETPAEWVRVFKYAIPKRFPDAVGEITIGAVSHKNFYFENMDLMWDTRNVTRTLEKATGDVKIGFGPGRVNDVQAVRDSHKFLSIVFLPFVYMYKMNNLSVFSTSNAYPKTFDFTRIEGEYHVEKGAADTRCFYVDSPQVVAYADGVVDFAKERVDMTVLTRLTTFRDPLPEWWVDELGRPAIGFRVRGDLSRPDLDPRLRKMEPDEIEKAVADCKAKSRMTHGALEKIRRL